MTYSGNKIFNWSNALSIVFIVVFGFMAFLLPEILTWYSGLIIILFSFSITAIQAFYFETTVDELIVKNYMLPFFIIRYHINEKITSIQLKSTSSRSIANAALQITNDGENSMAFLAASLKVKDWQALVDDLTTRKIPVTIEASKLAGKIEILKN